MLIEDAKKMLIVEPEECLGGWSLVNADPQWVYKGATAQQNQQNDVHPVNAQINQGIRRAWWESLLNVHMEDLWVFSHPKSAQRRLIRLGRWPGWSGSLLGAQVILLGGGFHAVAVYENELFQNMHELVHYMPFQNSKHGLYYTSILHSVLFRSDTLSLHFNLDIPICFFFL